jgi:chemotaxis protein MotB
MGKKRKDKVEQSGPQGAPEWVVTFTDMISLLVTFFVLLMTFSSMEDFDRLKIDAFFDAGLGVMEYKGLPPGPPQHYGPTTTHIIRGGPQPHARPEERLERIKEMGQQSDAERLELDLKTFKNGLAIEFGAEDSFEPGSDRVSEHLLESLTEIGEVLQHYPYLVVVEGYTDSRFEPSRRFPSAKALSFARAENAAEALLANSLMLPELVQVSGRGAGSFRASNDTPEGRILNRRIELRVRPLSKTLARYYERKRAAAGKEVR